MLWQQKYFFAIRYLISMMLLESPPTAINITSEYLLYIGSRDAMTIQQLSKSIFLNEFQNFLVYIFFNTSVSKLMFLYKMNPYLQKKHQLHPSISKKNQL